MKYYWRYRVRLGMAIPVWTISLWLPSCIEELGVKRYIGYRLRESFNKVH